MKSVFPLGFVLTCTLLGTAGCSRTSAPAPVSEAQAAPAPAAGARSPLPGMPPVLDPNDIYAADHAGMLAPAVKNIKTRVYVPNAGSNDVDVIDPDTFKVINHFKVGMEPQHVTPSYDLKNLWVLNDHSDSLTRIDPVTGEKKETIKVEDPYNMYYTPDGKYAIAVAERKERLDFYDAQTMKLDRTVSVPCKGVDHMDFSADGRYSIASCEFEGAVIKFDVAERRVLGKLVLAPNGMPQDVKTSPDGKTFYVADMESNGVWVIEPESFKKIGFLATGPGAHGLYASRDSKVLYVSDRGNGTKQNGDIAIVDFATRKIVNHWQIPNGGSPDMGGVSTDGKTLWLSGRYGREVYAFDTADGHLKARIPVGKNPHGLCIFPQPGRYSLGHTGVFR